jgi:hypothetical protein
MDEIDAGPDRTASPGSRRAAVAALAIPASFLLTMTACVEPRPVALEGGIMFAEAPFDAYAFNLSFSTALRRQ